jgi:AAA ATPase domain/AAA domain, putative AbiEii toxin, Type IV TA system
MMRLSSLTLQNFRGVREGTLKDFADVNLLIGRNNSGKTTVAEAIMRLSFRVCEVAQDPVGRTVQQIWSQPRNESEVYGPEVWYKQDRTQPMLLEAHVGPATVALQVKLEGSGFSEQPRLSDVVGEPVKDVRQFLHRVNVFRPADAINLKVEHNLWPQLIASRRDKLLTRALNHIFRLEAEGFQLLPESRLIVLFADHGLALDAQGDGTRAALRTLMMLTVMQKTLFLLEEPECHQHPGSLERFALTVCKQAREQQVQLCISTHSAECVRSFLKAAGEAGSESALFHLRLDDGLLDARRLDAEAVETLQNSGVDVRFLDLYG